MPFDVRDLPSSAEIALVRRQRRQVAAWLFCVAAMIFGMVVLGGATRLTGSGLSIMEWAPLSGALPPLSDREWQRLFRLYQRIPQYSLINHGFGLAGFKHIFWLEWIHRLWGRVLGVVFLVPLLWFCWHGAIDRRMVPRLALLFALGGLQGAVGWFMVASGFLPDTTAVSPYRLVIHLALALLLYAAVLWTALSTLRPAPQPLRGAHLARFMALGTTILVACTIIAGGFTAGLHAGLIYNTFPLMDGRLVPAGYGRLHPFLRNLTENVAAVQFDHRLLATATAIMALATVITGLRNPVLSTGARRALLALGAAVLLQYVLGVSTLLLVVPIPLAVAHQAGAVLLLTAALVVAHAFRGAPRPALAAGGSNSRPAASGAVASMPPGSD